MLEKQSEELRQKVKRLATQSLRQSDPDGWFEILYTEANGDSKQVPWAKMTPHPYLENWLQRQERQVNSRSALVIGCGLGDDAEALQKRGFKVTAFDISPTAIAWCQKRFPDSQVNYLVADLFALAPVWHGAFDFVFECRNIQALPLNVRSCAIESIGKLVAVGGTLLVITRVRDANVKVDGPPWPLSEEELAQFQELGFSEVRTQSFFDAENDSVRKLCIEYFRRQQ
ncbi:class I SAM-dependent methyltransferase [Scytonema sp. NUACC26]|uniref:class I SAM-dependent methyltransferase n=1 Tax=Scytonema sp. NUACC26 TaxID=3140176 RepID=UPI0034DBFCE8